MGNSGSSSSQFHSGHDRKATIGTLAVSAAVTGAAYLAWRLCGQWSSSSGDKSCEPNGTGGAYGPSPSVAENLKSEGTSKSLKGSASQSPTGFAAAAPVGPSRLSSSPPGVCDGRKLAKDELKAADDGRRSRRNVGGTSISEGHRSCSPLQVQACSQGYNKPEGINRNPTSRVITIITYNVWQKDVKLYERMNAIGELMQDKLPHIILLQEVTPTIYKTFTNFDWWNDYACVRPWKMATKTHFCVLLSKLPVRVFDWEPFNHSRMKTKLVVAEMGAKKKRRLVVANGHLKRPDPEETHSKKRIAQANEAIRILNNSHNVVFGGDMNWSEDLDGDFPLKEGWVDAWKLLRPRENGWTYDTKANPMMNGKRRLQKRLDRFLCKLKDFKLDHVDIIGMDEIPGLIHQVKKKKLPVLCSDHFGLFLAISTV